MNQYGVIEGDAVLDKYSRIVYNKYAIYHAGGTIMVEKKNHTWATWFDNVLNGETGSILFAPTKVRTDPGALHYHSQLELGFCLGGRGLFYIQNDVYPFEKGDISIIFPGENHIAQSAQNDISDWIFITIDIERIFQGCSGEERLKTLYTRERGESRILDPTEKKQVGAYLRRMITLHDDESIPEGDKQVHYAALLTCILCESATWKCNKSTLTFEPDNMIFLERGQEIYPAIQYIFAHYTDEVTAEQLCRISGISPTQLRRLFGSTVGMSPIALLHKIRISHACNELSSTQLLVQDIAERCGYMTLSSFNRQFQKIMQMSPSEYRVAHHKGA